MTLDSDSYDMVVIGSGPGGQQAAIEAATAGMRVLLVERDAQIGGACVHHGTIPSKTIHEMARRIGNFRQFAMELCGSEIREELEIRSLISRLGAVIKSHVHYMGDHLKHAGIEVAHGRASFEDEHRINILAPSGKTHSVHGSTIVIATGSRPRSPDGIPIDHKHVLDSDSILSLTYMPSSLTVLGAGVIAAEYATIFALLGSKVTMIDKGERPLSFLDPDLVTRLVDVFSHHGGVFLGKSAIAEVRWDGAESVQTTLTDGRVVRGEKLLCALGRVANLQGLQVERAGIQPNPRGLLDVDPQCRTSVPHIFAVGDVIGPPALASCSLEQGRRAAAAALGRSLPPRTPTIPVGIYTYPEIAAIGMTEAEARSQGGAIVGQAAYEELARGQISTLGSGLLKLVADASGQRLLGVHIIGEGATELVHIGQLALATQSPIDIFLDQIFNFPTLAEAYRVAALDILHKRSSLLKQPV